VTSTSSNRHPPVVLASCHGDRRLDSIFSGLSNLFSLLLSPAWVQTFVMTFLGEWGDRSQIVLASCHGDSRNLAAVSPFAEEGHDKGLDPRGAENLTTSKQVALEAAPKPAAPETAYLRLRRACPRPRRKVMTKVWTHAGLRSREKRLLNPEKILSKR
jgi:hypothetical protein